MNAYTDCPFESLGDIPNEKAPIREVFILSYDGNKYCKIIVEKTLQEIKAGYLYENKNHYNTKITKQIKLSKLEKIDNSGFIKYINSISDMSLQNLVDDILIRAGGDDYMVVYLDDGLFTIYGEYEFEELKKELYKRLNLELKINLT